MSTHTGDNDWWLSRQLQPLPSPSQPPRLTDRDFLLRSEPSRHSPAIKGLPSVTEADLQQELIHTVSHVCSPSLPPPYTNLHHHHWKILIIYPSLFLFLSCTKHSKHFLQEGEKNPSVQFNFVLFKRHDLILFYTQEITLVD